MLENLNGFLLVDKPSGIAFSTVIKTVKRKFNLVKVGHGGSLDTLATGLLVLLINDANKYVGDVMGADREYTGTMRLGLKTNTHCVNGEPVAEVELSAAPDAAAVEKAMAEFKGDVFQTEPRFASVRREGSAGYETADTGEHQQFMAHVYRFKALSVDSARMEFEVKGSKSLMVRTLVNDFGEALGCGAALEHLRRNRVGKFSVADAIGFEKLLDTDIGDFASCVLPLSAGLR
jgi:tRNA pseudouridine55 synthase